MKQFQIFMLIKLNMELKFVHRYNNCNLYNYFDYIKNTKT